MHMLQYSIRNAGECAFTVEFEEKISPEVNLSVTLLASNPKLKNARGIVETIPAYRSLTVVYNPYILSYKKLYSLLKSICDSLPTGKSNTNINSKTYIIPTCYGGEYGTDLSSVAERANLTADEVISIHSKTKYLIYMLGFLPGFAYLGGLDERLFTPRLESPRTSIPSGSVGIGGSQTGIYPINSPGGWNIIGRTPLKIYDPNRSNSILFSSGDYIRFLPISFEKYIQIEEEIKLGRYEYRVEEEDIR